MSTYVDKLKLGKRTSRSFYSNRASPSSARKYTSVDSVENNSPTESTSNVEHVVRLGAGLRSIAAALPALAKQAQQQIGATRDNLAAVTPQASGTDRQALISNSESDVNDAQVRMAEQASVDFNDVSDPNLRHMLQRRTNGLVTAARHGVVPIRVEDARTLTVNTIVPVVEEVRVDIDKNASSVDNFYVDLVFNIPSAATQNLAGIRIFRAEVRSPVFTRPLHMLSAEGLQRLQSYRGRKNEDYSQAQMLMAAARVPNSVSNLNYMNAAGQRVSSNGSSSLLVPPPLAGANPSMRVQNTQVPASLAHLDPSVLNDVNVITNIQNNPSSGFQVNASQPGVRVGANINTGVMLGDKQQLQVDSNKSVSNLIIDQSNALSFSEVAFLTLDKLKYRRIGDHIECEFIDEGVSYGRGYKYFVVTVSTELLQSARSNIVDAVIEVVRVPDRPSSVVAAVGQSRVAICSLCNDKLVEKFEIHRFEDAVDRRTQAWAPTIADQNGFSQQHHTRGIMNNNYLLVGECMNGQKSGGQFTDISVRPGRQYTYRVYSVDIFGNKSESPYEVQAYVPDLEQQFVKLDSPSIIAEVDSKTGQMRVTFRADDSSIETLTLERRDLTMGQEAYTNPYSPPRVIMGRGRLVAGRKALEGERRYDESNPEGLWSGLFRPTIGREQSFVDSTVQQDHIYQYRIYGSDRYGNRTPYAFSTPLMVVVRRFIDAPAGLNAVLTYDARNEISGVLVTWVEGNMDKSAEDLIGNQNTLAATSVRTMYQVQRLKQGEGRWYSFPLMTGSSLFDPAAGVEASSAPNFRPPYPDLNQTYFYRVQAVQTGAYISNFTKAVQVFTGFAVAQPLNFTLRTPDVARRPFFVMLNWDTQSNSGVVDKWEVQRADVNNLAAARINMKNPSDIANLKFNPFVVIHRESSRFSGRVQDLKNSQVSNAIITGQHYFMDTQVDFGNTYFYRIRAVSPEGMRSQWSYKGVRLTSSTFERKWMPLLTDKERLRLSKSYRPMSFFRGNKQLPENSMSVLSPRMMPDSQRPRPRVKLTIDQYGAE